MAFWDISSPLLVDGGMGTQLQALGLGAGEPPEAWNITRPEAIVGIHRAYLAAGARVITANTFGANGLNFTENCGFGLGEIVFSALANVRRAIEEAQLSEPAFAALDVGPSGKLLAPLGDFAFEDAVALYRELGSLGAAAGADLFFIETMSDLAELRAAVIGLKEAADLPIFATFTLEPNGRLLTGAAPAAVAATLDALGVAALGINCGAGPERIKQALPELRAATALPIIAQPNAGLPVVRGGKTCFDLAPAEFASQQAELLDLGASILGGCCGTTPAHIRALAELVAGKPLDTAGFSAPGPLICSATALVRFGGRPVIIGERINPTGKPVFQQHLRAGDWEYLLDEALSQAQAGAHALDINVGMPGIDEAAAMTEAVTRVQQASALPLQLDSANPAVLEAALRSYHGKALVNSVNGKADNMRAVFPLIQKYGGMVVALLLDEAGIPSTAAGRLAIAEKIYRTAAEYGIPRRDILIDALTMTVSADPASAAVTLDTMAAIHAQGGCTILGVSNISFGLPQRDLVNGTFFTMALQRGLSAAIINPKSAAMMAAYRSFCLLCGLDENCKEYLSFAADLPAPTAAGMVKAVRSPAPADAADTLSGAILLGREEAAKRIAAEALGTAAPLEIIQSEVIPALDEVGRRFAKGSIFLPQLLQCAGAAKAALALLQEEIRHSGGGEAPKAVIVMATVHGDIHDIGKNIAKTLLETYHYQVIDLGKDVPPQAVCEAVVTHRAPLCGLSALMTTTVPAMEATISLLRERAPWCRVLVGGAVLTKAYADDIGADAWCPDAMAGVRAAEALTSKGEEPVL